MLRSCLVLLFFYAALFVTYLWWLSQMFDPPGVWIGAAVVALIAGCCLGALYNSGVAYREWSLISSARHDLPWSDGRWTAVAGEIHPVAEPLVAPFSGAECIMCEYDITRYQRVKAADDKDNDTPGSDFTGFLMNPCVVRSRMGDVRLLGFPNLAGFDERTCGGTAAALRAREFLATSQFEDYSGLKLVTVVSAIKDAWTDDDGLVRKNIRLCKLPPEAVVPTDLTLDPAEATAAETSSIDEDIDEMDEEDGDDFETDDIEPSAERSLPLLKEKRVAVGEKVCAIGIYDGQKRGLVPGGLGADHFIRLIRGGIDIVESRARNSTFSNLIGGLIGLVVVHAAAYGVMMAKRYHPSEQRKRQDEAVQMVSKGDVAKLAKLVARGQDVNARDSEGRTLLLHARDPDVARWLIAHGSDVNVLSNEGFTPLMEATRYGRIELVKVLIEAKADINLRSPTRNVTALQLAEETGHEDIAALLRQAGAKDT
jgi:hypothetical protein